MERAGQAPKRKYLHFQLVISLFAQRFHNCGINEIKDKEGINFED
jgi:hypothetical protein